jgi:hypothetical protein
VRFDIKTWNRNNVKLNGIYCCGVFNNALEIKNCDFPKVLLQHVGINMKHQILKISNAQQ